MLIENVQITDFDKKPNIPASGEPTVTSTVKFRGVMTPALAQELEVRGRMYDDGHDIPAAGWGSITLTPFFEDAKVMLLGLNGSTDPLLTISETKIDNMKATKGKETLTLTFTARIAQATDRESISGFIEDNPGWVGKLKINPLQAELFSETENGSE